MGFASACWKTYLSRPEEDWTRRYAMGELGNCLLDANHHADALAVREAELSMERRLGASTYNILVVQGNLAMTYSKLGRDEEALQLKRDVYSGYVKLCGEEHRTTLLSVNHYADSLLILKRFEEARSLLRKTIPVARRVLGEGDRLTLKMRMIYAKALYKDDAATLDDLREAVTTLVETERTARRVLGGAHPVTTGIEGALRDARAALRARETPSGSA